MPEWVDTVKTAASHKYGPLPGYAWAGIAVVGGYVVIKRRASSSAAAADDGTDPTDSASDQVTPAGSAADQEYGLPYDTTGSAVYDTLASKETQLATTKSKLATETKKYTQYKSNHPGSITGLLRAVTVRNGHTKASIESKYGISNKRFISLNPELKGHKNIKAGTKVIIPASHKAKAPAAKK